MDLVSYFDSSDSASDNTFKSQFSILGKIRAHTYMESSHNAPIIHAFNLAQKRFFHLVNSQKTSSVLGQLVALRDTTFCSNHFLSSLEFTSKVRKYFLTNQRLEFLKENKKVRKQEKADSIMLFS